MYKKTFSFLFKWSDLTSSLGEFLDIEPEGFISQANFSQGVSSLATSSR